jgi:hypothetical protein
METTKTRTHRLAVKNSIGQWRTIGCIIADAETDAIISALIAANKFAIVLEDSADINTIINIQSQDSKGNWRLNNIPAIFPVNQTAKQPAVVVPQQTVMQQPAKQSADALF